MRLVNSAAAFEVNCQAGAVYLDIEPWDRHQAQMSIRLSREDAIQMAAGLLDAAVHGGQATPDAPPPPPGGAGYERLGQ